MSRSLRLLLPLAALAFLAGCETTHRVETVSEVKPIHITVDVNLKVDRELNNFFGDLDKKSALIDYEATPPDPSRTSTQ